MVLSFQQHHKKRVQRQEYRQRLVARITELHQQAGDDELKNELYLEHLREGFPIHILENILERLSQARAANCR